MLNKEKYYILNPAYFLRNDVHRAIIGSFDFPDIEDELYEKNAIHIIHPFTASMLSFFDGNKTLLQCIHLISEYFDISIDKTENIIDKYINNSEPLCILMAKDRQNPGMKIPVAISWYPERQCTTMTVTMPRAKSVAFVP